MMRHITKTLGLAMGISLAAVALAASAQAGSLRKGSTSSSGEVTGSLPGQVLWGYYQTNNSVYGNGDTILRLVNPNGSANTNLGLATETVCAMIYVFDEDQEMGECCGCPLSSAQLATFSAYQNLTSNWGLPNINEEFAAANAYGSLAVVAAAPNAPGCKGQTSACNGGCDPTNIPGYSVTPASNLLGSLTRNQGVFLGTSFETFINGLTETSLNDDGGGDPNNLIYLPLQCGALVGNGTGGGICNCPTEG